MATFDFGHATQFDQDDARWFVGGRRFTVVLDPDDEHGGYTATVPALPGVVAQGETFSRAMVNVKDAITLYFEDLVSSGEPIPTERLRFVMVTFPA